MHLLSIYTYTVLKSMLGQVLKIILAGIIDFIPKWPSFKYSFVFIQISP